VFSQQPIVRRPAAARARGSAAPSAVEEAALSDEYYEHILFVIRAAGKAMERSPATYARWGEEDRRQVLILMLNTHYEGQAMAEAFNADGDTDILIRVQDKNVFIGECKFYEGPQSVIDTVDQLFGYTTWRDVKLAIIFFVSRRDFTQAIERTRSAVSGHAQFRGWIPISNEPETELRARMAWPGDDRRLVTIHVSMFLTPQSPEPGADDEAES